MSSAESPPSKSGRNQSRALLESERDRVNAEIRSYPAPIPACDDQFNHLLEERARLDRELQGLRATGSFELYEGILWEPTSGYFILEHHLGRLERSAAHFGFAVNVERVRARLGEFAEGLGERPRKVRLELSADGSIVLEDVDVKPSSPVRVALAREPVDANDEFLRHKTSRRAVYERALAAHPEAQNVLLWNARRELTELCNANVVLEIDGRRLTPHVSSGLLPGTFRAHLLERGEIEEQVLGLDALERAGRLHLINSVRRWCEIQLL